MPVSYSVQRNCLYLFEERRKQKVADLFAVKFVHFVGFLYHGQVDRVFYNLCN